MTFFNFYYLPIPSLPAADFALQSTGTIVIDWTSPSLQRSTWLGKTLKGPENALQDTKQYWHMRGSSGHLVVKLGQRVNVTSFTVEHNATIGIPDICAPRDMEVWGVGEGSLARSDSRKPDLFPPSLQAHMMAKFTYNAHSHHPVQTFPVLGSLKASALGHQTLALVVFNNWGEDRFTCLYRFRVHGSPVA